MDYGIERFTPDLGGEIAYEHLHRYALAQDLTADLDVLDVACGDGYGAYILASKARTVVGVDIDAPTINQAERRYGGRSNLSFRSADALTLPLAPASFDAVVSFETIEHVSDPEKFLDEVKRVLRPTGRLIISTPNPSIYNLGKAPNPYHVHELDPDEFRAVLAARFKHVVLIGQRFITASSLVPLEPPSSNPELWRVFHTSAQGLEPARDTENFGQVQSKYLIAICSDLDIEARSSRGSIFMRSSEDLFLQDHAVRAWASTMHETRVAVAADLARLEERRNALLDQVAQQESRVSAARSELEQARERLTADAQDISKQRALLGELSVTAVVAATIAERPVEPSPSDLAAAFVQAEAKRTRDLVELQRSAARLSQLSSSLQILAPIIGLGSGQEPEVVVTALAGALARYGVLAENLARLGSAVGGSGPTEAALAAVGEALTRAKILEERIREVAGVADAGSSVSLESAVGMIQDRLAQLERVRERLRSLIEPADALNAIQPDRLVEALQDRLRSADQILARLASVRPRDDSKAGAAEALEDLLASREQFERLEGLVRRLPHADLGNGAHPERVVAEATDRLLMAETIFDRLTRLARETAGEVTTVTDAVAELTRISTLNREMETDIRDMRARLAEAAAAVAARAPTDVPAAGPQTAPLEASEVQNVRAELSRTQAQLAVERSRRSQLVQEVGPAILWTTPRPPLARRLFGRAISRADLANRSKDWARAEVFYAEALRRRPDQAHIWVQYGHALKEQRKLGLAELAYREAWRLAPSSADAPFHLARLLASRGAHSEAQQAYEAALRSEPKHPHARREMDALPSAGSGDGDPEGDAQPLDANASSSAIVSSTQRDWPPPSLGDFWLQQRLRDYLFDRVGEGPIPLYQYLMSFVDVPEGVTQQLLDAGLERLRRRAAKLAAAASSPPTLSVIIPVHNIIRLTLSCIVSVLEDMSSCSTEIIVGDDASTDGTARIVESIGGCVRLVSHPTNLGFLKNCNVSAEQARGRFIAFLNNDTLVLPKWRDELVRPLEDARVGLTGSKLLNGDGTLQEAGGIIWRDGSGWNFGRNGDPRAPEYNYSRDVDYLSGAAIALRTDVWRHLGGFDELYSPAYFEDTDLAFRLREAGFAVRYCPTSEVIHHEGRSHGRDLNAGLKSYQVINSAKFVARWSSVLARDHFPNGAHVTVARDRTAAKPHILIVDHYVPEVDVDAGSKSTMAFVRLFLENGFAVTFWPDNLNRSSGYTELLQSMGVEVMYGPDLQGKFADWLSGRAEVLDYVFLSRPHIAKDYIDVLERWPKIKRIYYGQDLHFRRLELERRVTGEGGLTEEISRIRQVELMLCKRCDLALFPSEEEVTVLKELLPEQARVLAVPAYAFDETQLAIGRRNIGLRTGSGRRLLFVGGFAHRPNTDGLIWFVQDIMPMIDVSGCTLDVVGGGAPPAVADLVSDRVRVHGRVSEEMLKSLYRDSDVVIAPLRYGGGVKGKVIEAMAHGVPVVSTEVGVQGIEDASAKAFVASAPGDFAEAVRQALSDPATATRKARAALDFIARAYTLEALKTSLACEVPHLQQR